MTTLSPSCAAKNWATSASTPSTMMRCQVRILRSTINATLATLTVHLLWCRTMFDVHIARGSFLKARPLNLLVVSFLHLGRGRGRGSGRHYREVGVNVRTLLLPRTDIYVYPLVRVPGEFWHRGGGVHGDWRSIHLLVTESARRCPVVGENWGNQLGGSSGTGTIWSIEIRPEGRTRGSWRVGAQDSSVA